MFPEKPRTSEVTVSPLKANARRPRLSSALLAQFLAVGLLGLAGCGETTSSDALEGGVPEVDVDPAVAPSAEPMDEEEEEELDSGGHAPLAPEAPHAERAPEAPEAPHAAEAPRAPEAPKAPRAPEAPEAPAPPRPQR